MESKVKRTGVVAIMVSDRAAVPVVNDLLSEFNGLIIGRIGLPRPEQGSNVIALIVEGSNDEVGALAGRLGSINGISGKSLLFK